MEIGTGLFTCQHRPDDPRSTEAVYDQMLEIARGIDDAGLASAWVTEHHFTDDGYISGVMPALGALAAATEDVTVGTRIAVAPFYDPVRLAEDAATVSLLSGGRLSLGLGSGYRDREFEGFGVPKDERVERTVDAVELLRAAWSPGPLDHESPFHDVDPTVSVTPKPTQAPEIVLGGTSRASMRRVANHGDGWAAPWSISMDGVRKRIDHVHRMRDEAGVDGAFTVYMAQPCFVADTEEAAWDAMRDGYLYMKRKYEEWNRPVPEQDPEEGDVFSEEEKETLRDQAILGPPETVIDEIETRFAPLADYQDDIHLVLRTYVPGVETDAILECIDRLGDEVAPHFR